MICRWCRAALVDAHGQPRWDLFSDGPALLFVCRDRCRGGRRG